jgi:hypothetical protein
MTFFITATDSHRQRLLTLTRRICSYTVTCRQTGGNTAESTRRLHTTHRRVAGCQRFQNPYLQACHKTNNKLNHN